MRSKMAKLKNRHKHKGFRFSVGASVSEIKGIFGCCVSLSGIQAICVAFVMTEALIGRLIHTPTHKQYCDSLTDVE